LEGKGLGDSPPLPSVRQWLDWKLTNILPKAGGTLDQDPEFMRDLREIMRIEQNWEKIGKAKAAIKKQIEEAKKGGKVRKVI
jgi:hypothetical protein